MSGTVADSPLGAATSDDASDVSPRLDANSFPRLQKLYTKSRIARWQKARILFFEDPAFRIAMFGSSISMFGSRVSTVALPMLVLYLNHSPFVAGLVAFAAIAPSVAVYMPAGALVDRWNPRRVMIYSELLRGLAVFSVVLLLVSFGKNTSIPFLIIAMIVEEILEIFSTLADRRYINRLMKSDKIDSRQSYLEVRSHAAVLAGRLSGPFLFAIGPSFPFIVDAFSFLFSIGSLSLLKGNNEPLQGPRETPFAEISAEIWEAIHWLKGHRQAWLTITLMAGTSLVAQALILMFVTEAHSKQLSTAEIGMVLAASGAGGAIGSVCSRFLPKKIRDYWLPVQMFAWIVPLAALVAVGGLSVTWSIAAMLVLGFTGAIGNTVFDRNLKSEVADKMFARVTSIGQMLATGACSLGAALGGAAVQHWGIEGGVSSLLGGVFLLALISLLTPALTEKFAGRPAKASSLTQGAAEPKRAHPGIHSRRGLIELSQIVVPGNAAGHHRRQGHGEAELVSQGRESVFSTSIMVDNSRPCTHSRLTAKTHKWTTRKTRNRGAHEFITARIRKNPEESGRSGRR